MYHVWNSVFIFIVAQYVYGPVCYVIAVCRYPVKGHVGRVLFGDLSGKSIVCMQGRIHAYEGHSMWQVSATVSNFVNTFESL